MKPSSRGGLTATLAQSSLFRELSQASSYSRCGPVWRGRPTFRWRTKAAGDINALIHFYRDTPRLVRPGKPPLSTPAFGGAQKWFERSRASSGLWWLLEGAGCIRCGPRRRARWFQQPTPGHGRSLLAGLRRRVARWSIVHLQRNCSGWCACRRGNKSCDGSNPRARYCAAGPRGLRPAEGGHGVPCHRAVSDPKSTATAAPSI